MAAALCGISAGDPPGVDRLETLYSVVFSYGGIPLLWMGDELGLGNDERWAADPLHADDNRWLHRPPMDWEAAERRHDPATTEGRLWAGLQRLARARRGPGHTRIFGDF